MTERGRQGGASEPDGRSPVRDRDVIRPEHGTSGAPERSPFRCDGGQGAAGLFDAMPDPALLYVLDDGAPIVTAANDAYVERFDVDPGVSDPLETRLETDLLPAEAQAESADDDHVDTVAGDVDELVGSAAAGTHTRTVVRADAPGNGRDYLARVVPLRTDGPTRGAVVLTDVTAQRERMRELRDQRDRLDEFASVVSHDLRNPIEVAKIHLEAARDRGDETHFETVGDALARMEYIVEDVLALARQGQVVDEVHEVTLSDVADDAWASISAPSASLSVGGDLVLEADAGRLQELLENLFRNAVEHAGPAVTVTVGRTDEGFYVADDGPGIPGDEQERVLEGGFTTTEEGTGLGLAIVRQIAEAHGWTVAVGTAADGGARFDVSNVTVVE